MIKYSKYNNLKTIDIIKDLLDEEYCIKCGNLYNQIETCSSIYENFEHFKEYNIRLNGKFTLAHSMDKKCKCKFNLENSYGNFSCSIIYNLPLDKELLSFKVSEKFSFIRVKNIFEYSTNSMFNMISLNGKEYNFHTDYVLTTNQVKSHFINLIFE